MSADEHYVIELAAKRATEPVHEELRLSQVCRPHDERVERNIAGINFFGTQVCYSMRTTSKLHRIQLCIHHVKLGVGDNVYMAVHVA